VTTFATFCAFLNGAIGAKGTLFCGEYQAHAEGYHQDAKCPAHNDFRQMLTPNVRPKLPPIVKPTAISIAA
jgi:hypothetical protein